MSYKSVPTKAEPPDEEILAANEEGLMIAGRVNGKVSLYIKAPEDIWNQQTEFGLVTIGSLEPAGNAYYLKTIGFGETLSSPLYRYLALFVKAG